VVEIVGLAEFQGLRVCIGKVGLAHQDFISDGTAEETHGPHFSVLAGDDLARELKRFGNVAEFANAFPHLRGRWSCDLFRCESATLKTHWVLLVMDQFTRRILGFGVHGGVVDGIALCRMFQRAIRGKSVPKYLSSDHDPLYRFQQWQANLRVLEVTEVKTVPYVPLSHPFVERLIGTIRREFLDRTLFWTTTDLEAKLIDFQHYYNAHRAHAGLEGRLPEPSPSSSPPIDLNAYRWHRHCRGLFQTPVAA
jgi:putative transposase